MRITHQRRGASPTPKPTRARAAAQPTEADIALLRDGFRRLGAAQLNMHTKIVGPGGERCACGGPWLCAKADAGEFLLELWGGEA